MGTTLLFQAPTEVLEMIPVLSNVVEKIFIGPVLNLHDFTYFITSTYHRKSIRFQDLVITQVNVVVCFCRM